MSSPPAPPQTSSADAFLAGARTALTSVFLPVLTGTYIGIGALAHDLGFSLPWVLTTTIVIWAGPAQVILISALGTGATPLEAAIAVTLSAVRLLPMVVTVLPLMRRRETSAWRLVLPAHFIAINLWVLSLRHLPSVPREGRVAFCNGMGCGMVAAACFATTLGFFLAANLPALFTAAVLFLTPMSFLVAIAQNAKLLADRAALVLGLILGPVLAAWHVDLDLLWTGIGGGTLAYALQRLRGGTP
jgi:predicted branched-subunit amino acid permease